MEGIAHARRSIPEYPKRTVIHRNIPGWTHEHIRDKPPHLGQTRNIGLQSGPPHPGIDPIPAFPDARFRALLDYRLYRLADTKESVDSYDQRAMSTKRKAMYHKMHDHEAFDGTKPVYAMSFLAIFAHYCDREQVH